MRKRLERAKHGTEFYKDSWLPLAQKVTKACMGWGRQRAKGTPSASDCSNHGGLRGACTSERQKVRLVQEALGRGGVTEPCASPFSSFCFVFSLFLRLSFFLFFSYLCLSFSFLYLSFSPFYFCLSGFQSLSFSWSHEIWCVYRNTWQISDYIADITVLLLTSFKWHCKKITCRFWNKCRWNLVSDYSEEYITRFRREGRGIHKMAYRD